LDFRFTGFSEVRIVPVLVAEGVRGLEAVMDSGRAR
jgi:hypothetical protein